MGGAFVNMQNNLKSKIFDHALPLVSKPGRYIGNEINMVRKDPEQVSCRIALVFPDVYEVGMSYMGFPILYNILNKNENYYAERAFAPWVDMEEQMRRLNIPLFSLETFSPLHDFDIIGFTFQYELHATSIVNLIDLAGLPIRSADRSELPLILLGGPSIYNPEPMADFIDAAVIGDGEEVVIEIAERVREAKETGKSREELLHELAGIGGVYVPSLYKPVYSPGGDFEKLVPLKEGIPRRIRARTVSEIKNDNYPAKPLVPMIGTTHDRVSLEIARGCSRGCRFCNAGFVYRPVRERSVDDLVEQAVTNIDATGYDEISLVSLSTSDYKQLPELMQKLNQALGEKMVNMSFPSLRPESFNENVARYAKGVRKSGLTLAPEAGTQRLRNVINKATSEQALLKAVDLAFREGWRSVKLYFMIGQPSETDEDLDGIIAMIQKVVQLSRLHKGRGVNVSVSPFVPKPLTPFQWCSQNSIDETNKKLLYISGRIRQKSVKLSFRTPDLAAVEGVLARGDRRLSAVIQKAWEAGSKLDGWSELYEFGRWKNAVLDCGFTFDQWLKGFDIDQPLPWDHIDKGVTKKFLRDEYHRALGQDVTPDCRFSDCKKCGLMGEKVCKEIIQNPDSAVNEIEPDTVVMPKDVRKGRYLSKQIVRIEYSKGEPVRYLSHLDLMRMFERAIRRAHIPIAYTEGYNPRPKISYGPALATGYTSDSEFMDVHLATEETIDLIEMLSPHLPLGIELKRTEYLKKARSLGSLVSRLDYFIELNGEFDAAATRSAIDQFMNSSEITVRRRKKGKQIRTLNIRPNILQLTIHPRGLSLQSTNRNGLSVRAEEVLQHLFPNQEALINRARVKRTALYRQDGEAFQPL